VAGLIGGLPAEDGRLNITRAQRPVTATVPADGAVVVLPAVSVLSLLPPQPGRAMAGLARAGLDRGRGHLAVVACGPAAVPGMAEPPGDAT
jgi:hypothetical protein